MEESQLIKSTYLAGAINKIGNESPYVQIAVGAGGGFALGFALLRTFKVAALLLGGAILTVELAVQSGIITIRWTRLLVELETDDSEDDLPFSPRRADPRLPFDPFIKIRKALINSARFSIAFLGGFLLGMGFS